METEKNYELEIKEEFKPQYFLENFLKKNKNVGIDQSKHIKSVVTVSLPRLKPPYCVLCDKYFCSGNDLQLHNNEKHVKTEIKKEFEENVPSKINSKIATENLVYVLENKNDYEDEGMP